MKNLLGGVVMIVLFLLVLAGSMWMSDKIWSPSFDPGLLNQTQEQEDALQFVSGTEYAPGQEGQIAALVLDVAGNAVTSDYACNYTILYPEKTVFAEGNFTSSTIVGTVWTNFTVPSVDGVYEYAAVCVKPGKKVTAGKSFHVTKKRIKAVTPK